MFQQNAIAYLILIIYYLIPVGSINITCLCIGNPPTPYDLLSCDSHFIVVIWDWTDNVSEVCLYALKIFYFPFLLIRVGGKFLKHSYGRLRSFMVAEGRTQLTNFTFTFHFHALEKEMATPSNVLAWRIPGMGAPGGLPSMGSHRVRHDWSDLAACLHPS